MAASPLYGAALSNPGLIGGTGGGLFQDPTYWPLQRRMSLAQALMSEGLSGAPAYPMQALGRVGQAIAGAFMENRAEKELQDTIAKQGADAIAAYQGALGPLGGALMPQAGSTASPLPPAAQPPAAPSWGGGGPGASVEMPKEYAQHYAEASQRTGIPAEVLIAKDRQESGFNPGATGEGGEIGIAQISPKTAVSPGFGMQGVRNPEWLRDPRTNINFGADYLAARAGKIDWHDPVQVAAALKSYNGGGDPNYAANVMRYLPQSYAMAATSPPAQQQQTPAASEGAPSPEQQAGMTDQQWLQQQTKTYPDLVRPWDVAAGGNTASDARPAVPMPGAAAGGGGAPAPPQQQVAQGGGPAPQQQPQAPQAQMPATGAQSPNIQQAIRMMQTAAEMRLRNPYNVQVQTLAHSLEQQAQLLMTLDTYATLPDGRQVNLRTGQVGNAAEPLKHFVPMPNGVGFMEQGGLAPPTYAPTPRNITDTHGNQYAIGPGGNMVPLTVNPTGITGEAPENVVMRGLAELGPKVASGTATPQEQATYATLMEQWRQPKVEYDTTQKQFVRVYGREPPPGYPPATTIGALTGGPQPSVTPLTPSGVGTAQRQAITEHQASKDSDQIAEEQAKVMSGHNTFGTTATIRSTLPQVATGVAANQRLAAVQILTALGMDQKTAQDIIGTSAAPGEVLQKKLFELTTGAVRGMGAREPGSVMLMFQKNYPQMTSRDMTIDAMTRLIDMDQKYKEDEIAGRQAYFSKQVGALGRGQDYQGLAGYQQPDPRLYQAAALATGGMPFSVWTHGLTSDQQTAALKLAASVYPDASALDAKGVRHVFQAPGGGG